ncbi:MAG: N-glycosylase/DNA lyase [Candidatus Omnitrophica bacterium]|nr:N-glycosylase/DNA lyase [Candidatus Omnitrophota bacterium]
MKDYAELALEYKKKKGLIRKRLHEFKEVGKGSAKDIFTELCFCILTPQSNARQCDKAIQELKKKRLLFKAPAGAIRTVLKGRSRFHNKKAGYLVNARRSFDRSVLSAGNILDVRKKIVENIKGVGYKEASHFLRNIGLGKDIAILDRHILKNLRRYGVIDRVPSSISVKSYLDIEERARSFAKKMGLGMEELDLLFWSRETGEIFK